MAARSASGLSVEDEMLLAQLAPDGRTDAAQSEAAMLERVLSLSLEEYAASSLDGLPEILLGIDLTNPPLETMTPEQIRAWEQHVLSTTPRSARGEAPAFADPLPVYSPRGAAAAPMLTPGGRPVPPLLVGVDLRNPDLDRMRPEQIAALGEYLGQADQLEVARHRRVSSAHDLPTRVLSRDDAERMRRCDGDARECCICLSEWEADETIRTLTCLHYYHRDCIDAALSVNHTCPLCQTDAFA
eukprot:c5980_g1_i1.p2 GENE.c5980_g1_i1~~c5980_g1_i1.p2  ORF type:complete len:243 (-),score=22.39 c5980_g1_i1:151-879(-)